MNMFKRPLIALSLTDSDDGLLQYAALALAGANTEEICFAHAVADGVERTPPEVDEARLRRISRLAQSHFGADRAGLDYEVVHGPRLDQVLSLIVKHRSDVVFLGHRRERSGYRSLSRRLAMAAPCAIWLVPEGAPARIKSILVPVDFSGHSAEALSIATEIAAVHGVKTCQVVHSYYDSSVTRYDETVQEFIGQERAAFDQFQKQTDLHGVQLEPIFAESTNPVEAILRVAHHQESDLIVMSTRGRSRSAAVLLGSNTSRTMAKSSIPLLAVKPFGNRMTLLQALLHHRFWEDPALK